MIDRYGVEYFTQSDQYIDKAIETNLKKYGTEWSSQSEAVKEKKDNTNLIKYGTKTPLQNETVLAKMVQTVNERYGKDYVLQVDEIINKINETMYRNGTVRTSKQQRHLHNLLGGELNYPVGRCFLDIAFLEEKIYIEYDGSGHNLQVRKGNISQEEFVHKERKRDLFLKSKGWKRIRIISPYDYLPSDEIILNEIKKANYIFSQGSNHYNIIIGKSLVDPVFGRLRKIAE